MKKKIDISSVASSLRGESVFFPSKPQELAKQQELSSPAQKELEPLLPDTPYTPSQSMHESNQTSLHASTPASNHASMLAIQPDIIEVIRKIVKTPAKEEVLYVRVTKEEKNQLGDIEYTFDRQGIETSANELGRIAINFLIADYKANGENSLLVKVLTALHA